MCIIIYNRDGKELDKDTLRTAYKNNPHGYGLMWYEDGRVKSMRRHGNTFDMLWETLEEFVGTPYALHLRWRTRGADGLEQCHPHRVARKGEEGDDEDIFLMHNGTLSGFQTHKTLSDSKMLARKMRLIMRSTDQEFAETLQKMDHHVESKSFVNRLLFMDSTGEVTFINEEAGSWIDDVWYSNVYSFDPDYRKPKEKTEAEKRAAQDPYRFDLPTRQSSQVDFWNDTSPPQVYRGLAVANTGKKTKTKKWAGKNKRRNKKAKKAKPVQKASNKMPGHYVDSKGNRTYVTESGAVIRMR